MRAGGLKKVIEFHKYTVSRDVMGAQVVNYTLDKKARAEVLNISGNREVDNGEVFYEYDKDFVVRFYHNIDENDRIKYDGSFYRIMSVIPDEDNQMKTIHTQKVNE